MNCVPPGIGIEGPNKIENSLAVPGVSTMFPFVKSVDDTRCICCKAVLRTKARGKKN
ncbi:MAG: hypothetical protein HW410_721 [Nitrosarchaeum sp.]|nr:hypothetical protein [Nitrosarchaeum sp.]